MTNHKKAATAPSQPQRFAILVGSIAGGFSMERLVSSAAAGKQIVLAHLAAGKLAESVEVQKPSSLDSRAKDFDFGSEYVCLGSGIESGFTIYGPFPSWEAAGDFGEENRGEDEEYEIMECHDFQSNVSEPVAA